MINPYSYSQQMMDQYGFIRNTTNSGFRLNSVESNTANYTSIEDWELSLSFKNIMRGDNNINLFNSSISKRFSNHYFNLRYTPGNKQDFVFNSRTDFLVGDTVQNYMTNLSYTEKYGLGYAANINENLTIGFSLRYFQQTFGEEYPTFFIDTVNNTNLIQVREETVRKNFWRGDIGLQYRLIENFNISISSINLFILKDYDKEDNNSEFDIKKNVYNLIQDKNLRLGFEYSKNHWAFKADYETSNSFAVGINKGFLLGSSSVSIGVTAFHDSYQSPFIAGILPIINYSTNLFSISLSYLKYISNRSEIRSLDDFQEYGIRNIQNNYFSSENINLIFNFALSFKDAAKAKFNEIEIKQEIFPTLSESYLTQPFAVAEVINISDKRVRIKPSVFIPDINDEHVYSPMVNLEAGDTAEIPFFIVVGDQRERILKTRITQAEFFLYSDSPDPDDQLRKTVLLHSENSWDGSVQNLRFYVRADFDFAANFSKGVIENIGNSVPERLLILNRIKKIYNRFVEGMNYIADRRASVDYVQFPSETIELKGGDCDDLSVAFCSFLEGIGIQTAFIDYKPQNDIGHVALLVNTELHPSESELITINDRKFFVRKNISGIEEIWIPLEITVLTNFEEAWNEGAKRFYKEGIVNFGLQKSLVEIVDVY